VNKTVKAAVVITVVMMMELKLILTVMTLPQRLTSPAEMLEHLFLKLL
jgi:hypothetical protein